MIYFLKLHSDFYKWELELDTCSVSKLHCDLDKSNGLIWINVNTFYDTSKFQDDCIKAKIP